MPDDYKKTRFSETSKRHEDPDAYPFDPTELDPSESEPVPGLVDQAVAAEAVDEDDDGPKQSVGRSTAIMSVTTFTSRITGFIRQWAMAFALGTGLLASSYAVANNLPNMIYELVAGGLLSTSFLPVFLEQKGKMGKDKAWQYASTLINIVLILMGIVTLLTTIFAPEVIATQAVKIKPQDRYLAIYFFRFFAIQIIFYGTGAIFAGLLNAHRKFFWTAVGPVFNNIVVIITLFAYVPLAKWNPQFAITWLAVGTTLGVVAMYAIQIPALLKIGLKWRPKINLHVPGLRATVRLAIPALIFTLVNLLCVTVRNNAAFAISKSAAAQLTYAWTWYQLPYGVLAVALITAVFTELSAAAGKRKWLEFKTQFRSGLRTNLFLIIPIAVLLMILAVPVITLYKAGSFTASDVKPVSDVLRWWAIALPFFSSYMLVYFAFSSIKDLKTVAIINAVLSIFQMALYWILSVGIGSWKGIGLIGVPITDLIFYSLMFFVLLWLLRKKIGGLDLRSTLGNAAKIVVASLIGGGIIWALLTFVLHGGGGGIVSSLITIVICGIAGLAIIWGICALFKVPEVAFLGRLARRFLPRKKSAE